MRTFRIGQLLPLLAVTVGASACAQEPIPSDVQAVIDRSHNSRANYAVFLTSEVFRGDERRVEVNAEFQQGAMHRVEVPDARILSNCETGTGFTYDVRQQRFVDSPKMSGGACGIAIGADEPFSAKMLEPITGTFGRADVIELTGAKFVRRYAVTDDGIIVANDYEPRRADVPFALRTLSVKVVRGTQDAAMFEPKSLSKAFAPAPVSNTPTK